MTYSKIVTLRNGAFCQIRNGVREDGKALLEIFLKTHEETDFLLTYPEENSKTAEEEGNFIQTLTDSDNAIEFMAVVDGKIVGSAGFEPVGTKYKVKHRAELGISVLKEYWGLGIGTALLEACIKCVREADYSQIELDVVADNEKAISLYRKAGFVEYGRNPRGFASKKSGYQELVLMRLELKATLKTKTKD